MYSQFYGHVYALVDSLAPVVDMCAAYEGSEEQQDLSCTQPAPPTQYTRPMDISEADDRIKRFYGRWQQCYDSQIIRIVCFFEEEHIDCTIKAKYTKNY